MTVAPSLLLSTQTPASQAAAFGFAQSRAGHSSTRQDSLPHLLPIVPIEKPPPTTATTTGTATGGPYPSRLDNFADRVIKHSAADRRSQSFAEGCFVQRASCQGVPAAGVIVWANARNRANGAASPQRDCTEHKISILTPSSTRVRTLSCTVQNNACYSCNALDGRSRSPVTKDTNRKHKQRTNQRPPFPLPKKPTSSAASAQGAKTPACPADPKPPPPSRSVPPRRPSPQAPGVAGEVPRAWPGK